MFSKTAVFTALFAAFTAAQLHAPVTLDDGNPITRPLNEAVVAGTPFTITWTPEWETGHTVSLLLVKGPPNKVVPIGEPIAEGIPNSGSYSWTVPAEFGPGDSATTGYGLQIIDDVDGKYQWSTQFGITIPDDYKPSSTPSGYPTGAPSTIVSSSVKPNSTTPAPTTKAPVTTTYIVSSTGAPLKNSSIIQPSKPLTIPNSLLTSTSTGAPSSTVSSPPESTGAASQMKAGLGLVAGAAGLFFML